MLPDRKWRTFNFHFCDSFPGGRVFIPAIGGFPIRIEASMIETVDFKAVFSAELAAIRERHNRTAHKRIEPDDSSDPSTTKELAGITCSGGGIRSASFCLGVLQGLESKQTLKQMDYLSTVSGGGYIGTTLTIGMSLEPRAGAAEAAPAKAERSADDIGTPLVETTTSPEETASLEKSEPLSEKVASPPTGSKAEPEAADAPSDVVEPASVKVATPATAPSPPASIAPSSDGIFPFGRLDQENRETPEVRHLRDNSRYLVQNGLPSVITAIAIYLRGIMMNLLVIVPLLLCAAAFLIFLNPDTKELVTNRFLGLDLTGLFGQAKLPFTILALLIMTGLLIVYAVLVSVLPIKPLDQRQKSARLAGYLFVFGLLVIFVEVHTVLLRLAFEAQKLIKTADPVVSDGAFFGFFKTVFDNGKAFVLYVSPFVVLILPFLKGLIEKATTAESSTWGALAAKLASRVLLLFAAALVPLLLWLAMMQLAYWGTQISVCTGAGDLLRCSREQITSGGWPHAPKFLEWYFANTAYWSGAFFSFVIAAIACFVFWPVLSVNSNSLHQLYRDRLGFAFLIQRQDASGLNEEICHVDGFLISDINTTRAPYHLINTALNVPGSKFANRRGRNADFFLFSKGYIGSEATRYVETGHAEKIVDGLNIGTAMAISGAAAAPNMGMASIRPLSPTIALMNVRLGRWVRHPKDIADRANRLAEKSGNLAMAKAKDGQAAAFSETKDNAETKPVVDPGSPAKVEPSGEAQLRRIPGPRHLLYEAFSKTGISVERPSDNAAKKRLGFVFLTDGGHIDNLGIYELLKRRCKLIIVIDGEADPDFNSGSLVQVERFARIDLNVVIRMNWEAIGKRTRALANQIKNDLLTIEAGPHVALGSISYPPAAPGGAREKGVMVYIKSSLSGDESDYVLAYKRANSAFPHETTLEQLFSEEQFEAYRALGEHIGRRFVEGNDAAAAYSDERDELLAMVRHMLPDATLI